MAQKWNLQDIKPAEPRKRPLPPTNAEIIRRPAPQQIEPEIDEDGTIEITNGNKKNKKTFIYALTVFFLIIGGSVVVSLLMGGAEVTVYPKHREPNVNAQFDAYRVALAGQLPYEIMTLEAEGERQVKATGKEDVKLQAIGKILIYNKHQSTTVRLVTNTRFSSPEGLIFRIKDSVVVPGYTKDENGQIQPGVTTAEVFADEVGEQYNLAPTKFTIPGFAGEAEFDNIYAESTDTFTGGYNGMKYIIEDSELKTAEQTLRTELRNSLLERIDTEKPAGFVVFNDAVTFTYVSLPAVEYGDNLATIKEKVIMRIPIFKNDQFASFIAAATIPGYTGEAVRITDSSVFTFSYIDTATSSPEIGPDIGTIDSIKFKLSGRPQLVWEYDADKLKTNLMNNDKTALTGILGAYPAIEKAEATIRPFWKTTFPIKITEIEIIESLSE